jgi:regulatory protein RepA
MKAVYGGSAIADASSGGIPEYLRSRYPKETSGKPDAEIYRAIDGAIRLDPQPAATSKRNGKGLPHYERSEPLLSVKRFKRDESAEVSEVPKADCSIEQFLERLFRPEETICICWDAFKPENSPKWIPRNSGNFAPLEKILDLLKRSPGFWPKGNKEPYYNPEAGVWIRVNPIKSGDESGTDASVASFRHLLVEFDGKPKPEQWAIFRDSKLPISAVIDSGGKSLHAWVRVDANTLEEFRTRQKLVYDYLGDYIDDSGNKNPSRFSRLPGVMREGKPQHVVSWEIGAKSWEEWEQANLEDGFPEADLLEDIDTREIIKKPEIVQGLFRQGHRVAASGGPKTKKSWLMMLLAFCVSVGIPFLEFVTVATKVLYINFELDKEEFDDRFKP